MASRYDMAFGGNKCTYFSAEIEFKKFGNLG